MVHQKSDKLSTSLPALSVLEETLVQYSVGQFPLDPVSSVFVIYYGLRHVRGLQITMTEK